jgi:hypothetical protein
MRALGVLLICVLVQGCAGIEPRSVTGPSGKQAYTMQCSGLGRTLDACYQKAGELCPKGYNIVDRPAGVVLVEDMATTRYGLVIECK